MCEITLDQPLSGVKELGNPTYSNVERVARRKNVSTKRTRLLVISRIEARQLITVIIEGLISCLPLHKPGN